MPNRYPQDIDQLLQKAHSSWVSIDPAMHAGPISLADFEATIAQIEQVKDEIRSLQAQLTDQRNRRDALYVTAWDQIKRLRYGVKAAYGDDSSQYEIAGGTRLSERKPRSRKKRQEEQSNPSGQLQ